MAQKANPSTPGILYVVATPIGNLEDLSPRALRVLQEVDLIAAEDTRHSKALLHHFGIATALVSLHEHNERNRVPQLLAELDAGKNLALISDAGTPLISDPGFHLLRSLHERGLRAIPIPGPSSLMAALSVAGLPGARFVFEGFLPPKTTARRTRLETLAGETRTLVLFEASHRIQAALADLAAVFGGRRRAVLARELTKRFEQIHSETLAELCEWIAADPDRRRGEFVIVVQGADQAPQPGDQEAHRLLAALLDELPLKQAVAVTAKVTGQNRNALYSLALTLVKER